MYRDLQHTETVWFFWHDPHWCLRLQLFLVLKDLNEQQKYCLQMTSTSVIVKKLYSGYLIFFDKFYGDIFMKTMEFQCTFLLARADHSQLTVP